MKNEYQQLLKSGMFFEFYPSLTGNWEKDKNQWRREWNILKKIRKNEKVN